MTNCQLIPVTKTFKCVWNFGSRFDIRNEVFISMSPTNYHCFIISGEHEFHPRFSFNKGKIVKPRAESIRAGLFFRFKNLSPEKIRSFQNYLAGLKGARSPSCHLGVLQALRHGLNVRIKGVNSDNLTPSQFFQSILSSGFETKDGSEIPFEVYVLKDKSMNEILDEIKFFERKFRWAYLASDVYYFFVKLFIPHKVIR